MKPRVAVFAFTSCEGCSLIILNLEEKILDLLGAVDVVNWREAIDEKSDEFDVAIIDGTVTRAHEVEELKHIRERAKVLIAIGACAVQGGVYALKNYHDLGVAVETVYGKGADVETLPVKPLSEYVKVDYNVYGCPINKPELVEVVTSALLGRKANIPDYPMCNECRTKGNVCVFEKGLTCMGPVTRAGCGALCPTFGSGCDACRGLVTDPPLDQYRAIMLEHGVPSDEAINRLRIFNGYWAEKK